MTPIFLTTSFAEMGGVSATLMLTVDTDWVMYPRPLSGALRAAGQHGLAPGRAGVEGRRAPDRAPDQRAGWGLHSLDVNIALFELVDLVARQAQAYR